MEEEKKQKEAAWRKEQTTQYNLRFLNTTGVPSALKSATTETGETTAEYMKSAVVARLRNEGFLDKNAQIVLNLNKQRHRDKLKKLEIYLKREKQKMK